MKQIVITLFLTFYLVVTSFNSSLCQPTQPALRIGYADVQYILLQLPDVKQAESNLNVIEKQLTELVNKKTEELKSKYDLFTKTEKECWRLRETTQ